MSVSGYSVQHDPEVQAYNAMRKVLLVAEKERKQQEKAAKREDKLLQEALKKDHRLKTQTDNRKF